MQAIFSLHGVHLPRDARMQAETGDDAGALEDLEAADLAFFSEGTAGEISHVGIVLGEHRMVHVALGRAGFALENVGNRRDAYVKLLQDRFVKARRVL